jgi:MazG family protein
MLKNTQALLDTMARLRNPDKGCPWDVRQSYMTLIPYIIEEAYEVIDAIERNDIDDLRAELGDLLLQVVFQAQIASENDAFNFDDVAEAINDKLIRRHPHVFADTVFSNDDERQQAWEQAKADERAEKQASIHSQASVLDGVPASFPALLQCEKIQDRAAHFGFDWQTVEPVFAKVEEELHEVKDAWLSGDAQHIEEEIGDLLLVAVNLARHLKVNPEIALKRSTQKFSRRFQYIEKQVAASGRDLTDCTLAELDEFWDEAKIVLKPIHD